ncbi:MAG: helix-turn-helix domain-containing protein [Bacteroidota bacterium]
MEKDITLNEEPSANKAVVIVAMSGNMLLNLAGPTDVFFHANKVLHDCGIEQGYDVAMVAPTTSKKIETGAGMSIHCDHAAMEISTSIDTLVIAGNDFREVNQNNFIQFYDWLSTRNKYNTRRIASICGGAFVLAKAGILEGKSATTHWELAGKLKKTYPDIKVNSDSFFTNNDGHVYTSAGVTTGIDLAISLVEQDHGRDIAVRVARKLVFYLSRPGLQAQFSSLLPDYGQEQHMSQKAQAWMVGHLHEKLNVTFVAEQMNMSSRNFTRVFTRQSGMPPAKFLEKIRVETARKYLEDTNMSLERISERCGLGGLVSMRRTFLKHLMTTPSDYRRAFQTSLHNGVNELSVT